MDQSITEPEQSFPRMRAAFADLKQNSRDPAWWFGELFEMAWALASFAVTARVIYGAWFWNS